MSQQTPCSLTGRPPSGPLHHPFWHAQHAFHAHQGKQPTGGQSSRGQHGQELVRHIGARVPHRRHHPPLILEAAAHHWERQCRSQPQARPLGGSRAVIPLLPSTPDPRFVHAEVSSPQKGYPNATAAFGRGPARRIGARVPHHRERPHRTDAQRQGGVAASWPRLSTLLATPPHPPFQASQRPSRPRASGTTTTTIIETGHTAVAQWLTCSPTTCLPPRQSTSLHPLDCARSEGECRENGGRHRAVLVCID